MDYSEEQVLSLSDENMTYIAECMEDFQRFDYLYALGRITDRVIEENKRKDRTRNEIVAELAAQASGNTARAVIAEALRIGYLGSKTSFALEERLRHCRSIPEFIDEVAAVWDGNDYLAGARKAAHLLVHGERT
jgi:hypothetical protein